MFKIQHIENGEILTVYDTKQFDGDTYFLVYGHSHWVWKKADYYKPLND